MIEKASTAAENLFISIKDPSLSLDAPFFQTWLRAAQDMQARWLQLCGDKGFAYQVERLRFCQEPDFSLAALDVLSELEPISGWRQKFVKVCVADSLAEEITIMSLVGFLKQQGRFYEFALPSAITAQAVKTACLVLVATEDQKYRLHPEYIMVGTAIAAKLRGKYSN